MPMKADNWKDLMVEVDRKARQSKNDSRASYNFRNIYFLDDMMHGHKWWPNIPKYLHMLQVNVPLILVRYGKYFSWSLKTVKFNSRQGVCVKTFVFIAT